MQFDPVSYHCPQLFIKWEAGGAINPKLILLTFKAMLMTLKKGAIGFKKTLNQLNAKHAPSSDEILN